jgi:uncharacterized membrane protein HdeD (DUF308 family)
MKNSKWVILFVLVIVFGLILYGSYISSNSFLKGLYLVATLAGISGIIKTWLERKTNPKADLILDLLFFFIGFAAAIIALIRL